MKPIELIREVKRAAHTGWAGLLPLCGVDVPDAGKHGPCPVCGGNDRFHYLDDHGGGEWHCRQCDPNHGDGLDLVARVNSITVSAAAELVAAELGIGDRTSAVQATRVARPNSGQEPTKEKPQADLSAVSTKVANLLAGAKPGQSQYLVNKGLSGPDLPILPDGSLVLALRLMDGTVTGAQLIRPNGDKKLVAGTRKKGAFISIGPVPERVETVVIAEGYATAKSATLLAPEALTIAAMDAGNLLPVALACREHWPTAKIIMAADNDWHEPGELDEKGKPRVNNGKAKADKAAVAVSGWVTVPPTKHKADWDDYRQQNGTEKAVAAFHDGLRSMSTAVMLEECRALGDGEALSDEEVHALNIINRDYTHVTIGGKHRIVSLKPCQVNGVTHVFEDIPQFRNYFLHLPKIARRSAGSAWLSWPGKNYKPGGVGFYPAPDKCPESVYNLFAGLAVSPMPGDCTLYLQHLERVICAGNQEAYRYLMSWLAHLIQKPDEKPSVAIVMKSVPGAGKGSMVKPLLEVLGPYAVHINGAGQIAGKFNATMANKLLVFADEVTISTRHEADKLKGIISEESINLERKGIDAEPMPNFARLIFASNSAQAIIAGVRERRYLVLEPAPEMAQDKGYFDQLHQWADNDGPAHLLDYLQHYDLQDFDPRRAPVTAALLEEIMSGLTGINLFIYLELAQAEPFRGYARITASDAVDQYLAWCGDRNITLSEASARSQMGKMLVSLGARGEGRPGRGLGVMYELPPADIIREKFAQRIGAKVEDIF